MPDGPPEPDLRVVAWTIESGVSAEDETFIQSVSKLVNLSKDRFALIVIPTDRLPVDTEVKRVLALAGEQIPDEELVFNDQSMRIQSILTRLGAESFVYRSSNVLDTHLLGIVFRSCSIAIVRESQVRKLFATPPRGFGLTFLHVSADESRPPD